MGTDLALARPEQHKMDSGKQQVLCLLKCGMKHFETRGTVEQPVHQLICSFSLEMDGLKLRNSLGYLWVINL